jgi:hypothetical protein
MQRSTIVLVIAAGLTGACGMARSQDAAAPVTLAGPLAAVQQESPRLMDTLEQTRPTRWKVKNDDRGDVDHNYLSVKSDLEGTLPGLLAEAQKAPQSLSKGLAVYQNVVALNDVLVRLQQTAVLTGGREDADTLQTAVSGLEAVRKQLGDALAALSSQQEGTVAQARVILAQQAAAAAAPKHIVVDESTPVKKKPAAASATAKKPAPKPPAAQKPAAQKPASGAAQSQAPAKPSAQQ